MKYKDFLSETTRTLIDEWGKRCSIHVNPGKNNLKQLPYNNMRAILFFGMDQELLVWNEKQMPHLAVAEYLGLPIESCLCLDYNRDKNVIEPSMTTLFYNPEWYYGVESFSTNPLITRAFGNVVFIVPSDDDEYIDEDTSDNWFDDYVISDDNGYLKLYGLEGDILYTTRKNLHKKMKAKNINGKIISVYIKMKKPLVVDFIDADIIKSTKAGKKYDGIICNDEYVVFDKNNVMSADSVILDESSSNIDMFMKAIKNEPWRYVKVTMKAVNKNTAELSGLYADYPGSGAGQAALYRICELADLYNIKIVLTMDPDSDQEKLERLYTTYGFVSTSTWGMARNPGTYVEILDEKIEEVIYHGTTIENAIKILLTKEIRLGDFYQFISLTRNSKLWYGDDEVSFGECQFVIDLRKLRQTHKIMPVDYYSNGEAYDYMNDKQNVEQNRRAEAEERVFKPIPLSYVKELLIAENLLVPEDDDFAMSYNDGITNNLDKLMKLADENKIKIKFVSKDSGLY